MSKFIRLGRICFCLVAILALGIGLYVSRSVSAQSGGQPGALDMTFDTDGKVLTSVKSNGGEISTDIALQADGKILLTGGTEGTNSDFVLARYNADGSPDTSFGTGGRVTTDFNGKYDFARSVVVRSDGKIVVGGQSNDPANGFASLATGGAFARYNTDGSLDTAFGTGGKLLVSLRSTDAMGMTDTLLQPDGKLVVVGDGVVGAGGGFVSQRSFYVGRYNENGALDSTFANGGYVLTNFADEFSSGYASPPADTAQGVALQADGKIVVVGSGNINPPNTRMALARYDTTGALDTTFSGNGKAVVTFIGAGGESGYGVAVQADGKIVAVGTATSAASSREQTITVARLNTDGALDSSFDSDGKLTTDFGAGSENAARVVVQQNGRIVVVGGFNNDFAVARYNTDGALDSSFDGDGKLTTDFGGSFGEAATNVVIQPDGKIVAGGISGTVYALARYLGDSITVTPTPTPTPTPSPTPSPTPTPVPTPSADGELDTTFDAPDISGNVIDINVRSDGKILLGGLFTPGYGGARLNSNGSLDSTFNAYGDEFNRHIILPNGQLLVAGSVEDNRFSSPRFYYLTRRSANNSGDNTFVGLELTNNPNFNPLVYDIALQTDGKIIVVGAFGSANGTAHVNIVRLQSNGAVDTTFNPIVAPNGSGIQRAIIQPDGKILIGGEISQVNGVARDRIARLNADGTLDTSFVPSLFTSSQAGTSGFDDMVLQPDGKIVVSAFNQGGYVRRLNADGSLDTTFAVMQPTVGYRSRTIALQQDGKIVVGLLNNSPAGAVRRLNADGTIDSTFSAIVNSNIEGPTKIVVQPDGKILVAARGISSVNGVSLSRDIIRLRGTSVSTPTPTPTPTPVPTPTPTPVPTPSPTPVPTPTPTPTPVPTPSPTPSSATTPVGGNVNVQAGNGVMLTFLKVLTAGTTTVTPITPSSAGQLPAGYTLPTGGVAFEITTTATYRGLIEVCISVPNITDAAAFAAVRVMHRENGVFVDRTDKRDFARKVVCGRVSSLSPFVIASSNVDVISETNFFVRQQYLDFLNREPDAGGFAYWTGEINKCGTDQSCIRRKRIDVSAAFFVENEFQQTGYFVYRLYRSSFARQPNYGEFMDATSGLIGGSDLAMERADTAARLVNPAYASLDNRQYVEQLYANAGVTPSASERDNLIAGLNNNSETRASVLSKIADNQTLQAKEYNQAFVLAEYFGYLRRDPDPAGYQFWLDVLNNRVRNNYRAMVCAFANSVEYQDRFTPVHSHTDTECGQ